MRGLLGARELVEDVIAFAAFDDPAQRPLTEMAHVIAPPEPDEALAALLDRAKVVDPRRAMFGVKLQLGTR